MKKYAKVKTETLTEKEIELKVPTEDLLGALRGATQTGTRAKGLTVAERRRDELLESAIVAIQTDTDPREVAEELFLDYEFSPEDVGFQLVEIDPDAGGENGGDGDDG